MGYLRYRSRVQLQRVQTPIAVVEVPERIAHWCVPILVPQRLYAFPVADNDAPARVTEQSIRLAST